MNTALSVEPAEHHLTNILHWIRGAHSKLRYSENSPVGQDGILSYGGAWRLLRRVWGAGGGDGQGDGAVHNTFILQFT